MTDGDAGSNLVTGEGTNALTFALPAAPRYKVESVVATVDNTAGADTGALLEMADTNGVVIAAKRQGQSIDAGATTTATWALRLDDEGALLASSGAAARCSFFTSATITAGNNWTWDWVVDTGNAALLDLTNAARPEVKVSGIYAIGATMLGTVRTPGQTGAITLDADFHVSGGPPPPPINPLFAESDFPLQGQPNAPTAHLPAGSVAAVWYLTKGTGIDSISWHSNAADRDFRFFAFVQRIT